MINLIVAHDDNRGIGKIGSIPWHFRDDMKFFKEITTGYPVIMGRKTWESLPKKPLSGRANIIITSSKKYANPRDPFRCYSLLKEALGDWINEKEIFIIGGQQLFEEAIDKDVADRIYLTHIYGDFSCDRFFPRIHHLEWKNKILDCNSKWMRIEMTRNKKK